MINSIKRKQCLKGCKVETQNPKLKKKKQVYLNFIFHQVNIIKLIHQVRNTSMLSG